MLTALRHCGRLLGVARGLARHDALGFVARLGPAPGLKLALRLATLGARRRPDLPAGEGERLAAALRSLGPAYIKLGQMLATRPDLVGRELAQGLMTLQDRLPPFPAGDVHAAIAEALGAPVEDLFTAFDDTPVAAASIAQVHKAQVHREGTREGATVAVKVLRPGIEERFARDLDTFGWLAATAERHLPASRRLRPVAVVETIAQGVAAEMDLRLEAAAASDLAANMAGEPGYRIPAVDWQRTARRVLTMEWIDGVALTDGPALKAAGHDRAALAGVVVRTFLTQAVRDGFFHADLHQGNLIVEPDGTIAAVDFGIVGRLDRATSRYLAEILWGFLQRDYARVAQLHFDAGYVPADRSVEQFALALKAIGEPIMGKPVSEISVGRLLAQLFATTEAFDMQTQPQLLMLQRTMVMVEGMALHLDAHANMWELSRPVVEAWMVDQLSPEVRLADTINRTLKAMTQLPDLVDRAGRLIDRLEAADKWVDGRAARSTAHPARATSGRGAAAAVGIVAVILVLAVLLAP